MITNLTRKERVIWLGYLYLASFGIVLGLKFIGFSPSQTLPAVLCGPFAFMLLNPPLTWISLVVASVVVWLPTVMLNAPWLIRMSAVVAAIIWLLTGVMGVGLQV